jgi:hypothetical protein
MCSCGNVYANSSVDITYPFLQVLCAHWDGVKQNYNGHLGLQKEYRQNYRPTAQL